MNRQECDISVNTAIWGIIGFVILGCFLIGTSANATIHVISNDSLPYTLTSGYSGDTIQILGTKITTTGSGISLEDATDVLLDFGTDTLEFGTDYGDNYYGIEIGSIFTRNATVRGGTILHGVQNCGINGIDTSYNCMGILIKGCNGLFLDSVNVIVGGFDATVVRGTGYQSHRNVEVRGGNYVHDGCGYTSREMKSEVFHMIFPSSSISGDEFHFKAYGANLRAIHAAFAVAGLQYIYDCVVTMDARNDLYRYNAGEIDKPNATDAGPIFHAGTTQSYAFMGERWGGSEWHDNLVLTDSVYEGLDGGFYIGSTIPDNNYTDDTVRIYNNIVYGHRGLDSHYGYMNCKGIKMGGNNLTMKVYDNEFYLTVDTDSTELGGNNFRGSQAIGFDWYATGDATEVLIVENNYFEIRNVSASGMVFSTGLRFSGDGSVALNNTWRNNHVRSSRQLYSLSGYAPYGRNFLIEGDTVGQAGTSEGWRTFYCPSSASYGNVFRDLYYDGISETSMVWSGAGTNSDITLQRTLQVYIMGNNGLPVANAVCSVWNNYGQLVIDHTTNSCGLVSGVVPYWFDSYAGDSVAYNDFRIQAVMGSDTVVHNNFTVGYTLDGGLDTLILQNTVGFDDGSDCIDTIPPATIYLEIYSE